MQENLKQSFSYTFKGNIWRILADPDQKLLVAEVRDSDLRQVSFAAVHLGSQQLLFKDLTIPETWWASAILLHQNILLLQSYPDSQTPQPHGLIAIDAAKGLQVWQNTHLDYVKLTPDGLIAYQLQDENLVFFLLDLLTGTVREPISNQRVNESSSVSLSGIIHPSHYTSESTYFNELAGFLEKKWQIKATKAFDYAEYQSVIIISYYIYHENTYSNFILVLDESGNVRLHEKIASNLAGTGLDTFMVVNTQLIFIKDKHALVSYEI